LIVQKALSIKQPWASLIIGYFHITHKWLPPEFRKDIENRDWRYAPSFRGKLLIHASKSFDQAGVKFAQRTLSDMGCSMIIPKHQSRYERGKIIGEVRMNDVVTLSDSPWFSGRLGFKFRMPKPIEPISYKGSLNFWEAEIPESKFNYIER